MTADTTGTRECRFCSETSKARARKCRYCGAILDSDPREFTRVEIKQDVENIPDEGKAIGLNIERLDGSVALGKTLRDEQYQLALNWDGQTRLRGLDLSGRDLSRSDLTGADLRGPKLSEADLNRANLSEARLSGANLSEAVLSETTCACGRFVRLFELELFWPVRYLAHIGQCQACGTISWWGITLR
ncbi:MAG: pentapeptide repeat-containing protein [Ardenticatenaceae bacterium]|nr:pentapeptide repeat-containing protein [Ardenticatenaceae bacterium]